MRLFLKQHIDSVLLGLILFIAFILRTYNIFQIPFTHDEFSAIFRTQFSSFHDLIEQGVKVDGHPPLIQVFLYYWIAIFGISEFWIKLPFIISGVASVFLAYKIGKEWFGSSAALFVSLLLAVLEYPVLYSQIARPYISGLFFVLLFVYFWNKLLFHSPKNKTLTIIGYSFSGALAAYDHHFALLQVAIIGLSGLVILKRKAIGIYILANILVILFYLPNLTIFFAQLELKGIEGWLSKPDSNFIFNYLFYISNFSNILGITFSIILLVGLYSKSMLNSIRFKFILFCLIWFIVPYLIGYYYSIKVNAVLQFSVLIFAFPFLLFGLAGIIRNNSIWYKITSFLIISIVGIYSLVAERKHYQIFYKSPYEKFIENSIAYTDSLGSNNCMSVFSISLNDPNSTPALAHSYYLNKLNLGAKLKYISVDSLSDYNNLDEQLRNFKGNYILYGYLSNANPETYPLIQHYFPYVFKKINYSGGDIVIFSKLRFENDYNTKYSSILSFENKSKNWDDFNEQFLVDSIATDGKFSYRFDSISEWGPAYSDTLFHLASRSDYIDISVDVFPLGIVSNALLVSTIDEDTLNYDWRSTPFAFFNLKPYTWSTVTHSIKLPDLIKKEGNPLLKVFIWNNEKQNFLIDNFRIGVRKGNPILYWLVTKEVKSE